MESTKREDAATTTRESYGIKESKVTKDEALRLALEALEGGVKTQANGLDWIEYDIEVVEQAITAIKAALKAKDEPLTENGMYRLGYHNGYGFGEAYGKANAPQRTWVGLTDEEIKKWWASENGLEDCDMCKIDDFILVARAIEAKLRRKTHELR